MICPFCELDPYEYADVGIGSIPIAVNCCTYGYLLYDRCMPYQEVLARFKAEKGYEPPYRNEQVDEPVGIDEDIPF